MVEAAEEDREEDMDKADAQAKVEAEEGEEHKISHSSHSNSNPENRLRHKQILKGAGGRLFPLPGRPLLPRVS